MFNLDGFFRNGFRVAPHDFKAHATGNATSIHANFDPANHAVVTLMIAPGKVGQVKFRGGWWASRCRQDITLHPGEIVYVLPPLKLPLDVEPVSLTGCRSLS